MILLSFDTAWSLVFYHCPVYSCAFYDASVILWLCVAVLVTCSFVPDMYILVFVFSSHADILTITRLRMLLLLVYIRRTFPYALLLSLRSHTEE